MTEAAPVAHEATAHRITLWHVLSAAALQVIAVPMLLMPYGRRGEMSAYSESCAVIHYGIMLVIFFMRMGNEVKTSVWDVVYVYLGPVLPAVAGIIASVIRDGW